jgi:hypothetical protein
MSESKQTVVEWLSKQLMNVEPNTFGWDKVIEQAEEMYKKEIIDAHGEKYDYSYSQIDPTKITGEQYYNETYGGNENE